MTKRDNKSGIQGLSPEDFSEARQNSKWMLEGQSAIFLIARALVMKYPLMLTDFGGRLGPTAMGVINNPGGEFPPFAIAFVQLQSKKGCKLDIDFLNYLTQESAEMFRVTLMCGDGKFSEDPEVTSLYEKVMTEVGRIFHRTSNVWVKTKHSFDQIEPSKEKEPPKTDPDDKVPRLRKEVPIGSNVRKIVKILYHDRAAGAARIELDDGEVVDLVTDRIGKKNIRVGNCVDVDPAHGVTLFSPNRVN